MHGNKIVVVEIYSKKLVGDFFAINNSFFVYS